MLGTVTFDVSLTFNLKGSVCLRMTLLVLRRIIYDYYKSLLRTGLKIIDYEIVLRTTKQIVSFYKKKTNSSILNLKLHNIFRSSPRFILWTIIFCYINIFKNLKYFG